MNTETSLLKALAESIAVGLSHSYGIEVPPSRVKMPARGAEAGVAVSSGIAAEKLAAPSGESFPAVCGVSAIDAVRYENGWLLFTVSEAFFQAIIDSTKMLPLPADDGEKLALNRLLALRRHRGTGCPDRETVREALWLCACAAEGRSAVSRAEKAVLSMFDGVVPKERPALYDLCGETADAACRLLNFGYIARKIQRGAK